MAPSVQSSTTSVPHQRKRLILCFDGTGNSYSGTTADTNVIKLFEKFDKLSPDQFHYYQPGIGTYTIDPTSLNLKPGEKWVQKLKMLADQAAGLLFDAHVIAGYHFVMRHFGNDDRIFIFGFSRGAFTARFLARMICAIGILAKGNEEMLKFAYKRYQDSITKSGDFMGKSDEEITRDLEAFKKTFCRESGVYFLGLWDTVNSVGIFRLPGVKQKTPCEHQYDSVAKTANYIRHAVAIDERRCKFRPALLIPGATVAEESASETTAAEQTKPTRNTSSTKPRPKRPAPTREVFFAGNHCDIGGGYPSKAKSGFRDAETMQLSDIPLNWMLEELDAINAAAEREEDKVTFNEQKMRFQEEFRRQQQTATTATIHDSLSYTGGEDGKHWKSAALWKFVETLPLERLELLKGELQSYWQTVRWPPNFGDTRDVPDGAEIHATVQSRIQSQDVMYRPKNQGLEHLRSA